MLSKAMRHELNFMFNVSLVAFDNNKCYLLSQWKAKKDKFSPVSCTHTSNAFSKRKKEAKWNEEYGDIDRWIDLLGV